MEDGVESSEEDGVHCRSHSAFFLTNVMCIPSAVAELLLTSDKPTGVKHCTSIIVLTHEGISLVLWTYAIMPWHNTVKVNTTQC